MRTIDTWRELLEPRCAALIEQAADAHDVASIERLRRDWLPQVIAAAINLAAARHKARIKFPDRADTLVADVEGVEQATSSMVANHKA